MYQCDRGAANNVISRWSVQPELAANKPKFLWRDEPAVGNTHSVERPIEIGRPIIQKIDELRKFRRHVLVLPEVPATGFVPIISSNNQGLTHKAVGKHSYLESANKLI